MLRRICDLCAYFVLVCLLLPSHAAAQSERSAKVEAFLREANRAGVFLAAGDVARMEEALEPGYTEISLMNEAYRPSDETDEYLRRRGWGHLVWTQIMYRLLAIQNGVYDRELAFAERVALESAARGSLRSLEISLGRLGTLLEAKEKFGLGEEIDQFAQGLMGTSGQNYREMYDAYQARFFRHKDVVMVRLALGRHPGIIDPADIPAGTEYAARCAVHRDRLQGENRVDEILNRLAEYDPERVDELALTVREAPTPAEREAAANELRVQLLFLEDSLAATERDPHVQALLETHDDLGYLAFSPVAGFPEDFREVMVLVESAKRNLREQSAPAALRGIYALGTAVR